MIQQNFFINHIYKNPNIIYLYFFKINPLIIKVSKDELQIRNLLLVQAWLLAVRKKQKLVLTKK